MWMRTASAMLAVAALAGCNRGGGDTPQEKQAAAAQAKEDSVRNEQKALIDAGVTVDTQVIDTGGAKSTPAEDN